MAPLSCVVGVVFVTAAGAAEPVATSAAVVRSADPHGSEPAPRVAGSPLGPLPRYFTIELRRDRAWVADGVRFATLRELELALLRAAETRLFVGVAVFGDAAPEDPRWRELSEALSRVRLSPIRHAGRPTPTDLVLPVRAQPALEPRRTAPAAQTGSESERPAPAPGVETALALPSAADPRVTLSTVGLHVAGAANREDNRRKLVAVFERRFDAFQRCHALARPHTENASFGIDLLVPAQGGKATVRQTRTRIGGAEFRGCMQRVFQAIVFEPPPTDRSEIVSYSVLFKPSHH